MVASESATAFCYDVNTPVAVFLGPSLGREHAAGILTANYYPPARMGDVYRLIASGVRLIVLIDGIFHAASAVWHREICEALAHGIGVIGASSMGALRASELHTYGMVGIGVGVEWYRDGVIDGDDEVALLHGDADSGFRALSQPLVNIRHKLDVAVSRGVVSPDQAHALTALAKRNAFSRRSYRDLLASDLARQWPADTCDALQAVFADTALDLKARDATLALRCACAMLARSEQTPARAVPAPSRFYLAASKRKRGFLHPDGYLVTGEMLWEQLDECRAALGLARGRGKQFH